MKNGYTMQHSFYNILLVIKLTFHITFISTHGSSFFASFSPLFPCFSNVYGGFIKMVQFLGEMKKQIQCGNTLIMKWKNYCSSEIVK